MAVWNSDENGLDWMLVQGGFCTAFRDAAALSSVITWLDSHDYRIVRLDTSAWIDPERLHDDFATQLNFPSYYGRNLDALRDCLSDVAEQEYGWSAADRGLIIALEHFDTLAARSRSLSADVLQIIERACRLAALLGYRVLCLIQSADDQMIPERATGDHRVKTARTLD